MRRPMLPIALLMALAVVSCVQNWLTRDDSPGIRIAPTSIEGDTVRYTYTYVDGDDVRTDTLATFFGVWHIYAFMYTPDWRVPPTNWYEPSNKIYSVSARGTEGLAEVARFVENRGDVIEWVRYSEKRDVTYVSVRLWGAYFDGGVPADRPFLDALDDYRQRGDLFLNVHPSGPPAELMRASRSVDR